MQGSRYRNGDIVSGAALTGLGLYIVAQARAWDYMTPDGPGPGFFPMWYGIALVALSLPLLVRALGRRVHPAEGTTEWGRVGRALIAWIGLTLCIALLKMLGFLLSFALLTFFTVTVMYRRGVMYGVTASVAIAALFYVIFPLALNVALPVGALGF